ncbi:MAG: THUMP domain-containing class I SAM-dependent RNA methyltransferase, partial [Litorivicinus sp.]
MKLILSAPGGLEDLVADQAKSLGCDIEHVTPGEVRVDLEDPARVYELLLWLRHASRVVLSLAEGMVDGPDSLYRLVQKVDWTRHLPLVPGFRVDVFGRADWIRDDRYAARVTKDAIVDQFWDKVDERPNTGPEEPLRVEVRIFRGRATIGLNLAGEALDRRGYRLPGHPATLREGIGAALLDRARWTPETPLLDPFCGSGTLILEAAMRASGTAPGLYRENSIEHWLRFKPAAMEDARTRALKRRREPPREPRLWGRDIDPAFIELAQAQAKQLGLVDWVKFEVASVAELPQVERPDEWLVLTNPPWGKRLATQDLEPLYETLGQQMKAHWPGAKLAVLTDRKELAQAMGLRVGRRNVVSAGPD